VRSGQETTSEQLADRLATGAELEEVELLGERLHYRKLSGEGPDEGWVSVRLKGSPLVLREGESAEEAAARPKAAAKAKAKAGPPARAPRVLCLHGTASGTKIMEMQLMKLFSKAKGKIDFHIAEGPKQCNMQEAIDTMSQFFKGKPMMMYDELQFDERNWRCYKKVRDALTWLQAQIKKHGPFDGVLGFSQGANFAVMLAAQSYTGVGKPLSFVIPMCPNAPGYVAQLPELFEAPLPVPALIVRGEQEEYDEGVKKTMKGKDFDTQGEPVVSQHVVRLFEGAEVFTHPDGHRPLPSSPGDQDELIDKIISFALEKAFLPPAVREATA